MEEVMLMNIGRDIGIGKKFLEMSKEERKKGTNA